MEGVSKLEDVLEGVVEGMLVGVLVGVLVGEGKLEGVLEGDGLVGGGQPHCTLKVFAPKSDHLPLTTLAIFMDKTPGNMDMMPSSTSPERRVAES